MIVESTRQIGEHPRLKLCSHRHPWVSMMWDTWLKWRLTYCGGDDFIEEYLKQHKREDSTDFTNRKDVSYVPAFAKAAVIEVKNAVFRRLGDVVRQGGTPSYQLAVAGDRGGVDRCSSSMSAFLGNEVLPELLPMARVGVWVDREQLTGPVTRATPVAAPYLYTFKTEDIKSWTYDSNGQLSSILLEYCDYKLDPRTKMPYGEEEKYWRWARMEGGRVVISDELEDGSLKAEYELDIPQIPFVMFELEHSLLEDVCGHQIALLNIASTDVDFLRRANIVLYTEQFDPKAESQHVRTAQQTSRVVDGATVQTGTAAQAQEGKKQEIIVGPGKARRYPANMERPGFIHPSPEPLMASMAKQEQLKREIRSLVHLSVATLDPNRASAESKEADDSNLNNGLLAIASILEHGERRIAEIWASYEAGEPAVIRYPTVWTMQTDADRREDAKELKSQLGTVPSKTYRKEVAKQIANKLVGHKISDEVLKLVYDEVEKADGTTADIEELAIEIENRLVSAETASKLRGYPEGEHKKALDEQAKQLAIIAISQAKAGGAGQAQSAARGGMADDDSAAAEKKMSNAPNAMPEDNTRGEGK